MPEQPERNDRERTTVVTKGEGGSYVWLFVAAIVVALGAIWYFGSGALDGTQTSDINVDVPEEVDVDIYAPDAAPAAPEMEAVPSGDSAPEPAE